MLVNMNNINNPYRNNSENEVSLFLLIIIFIILGYKNLSCVIGWNSKYLKFKKLWKIRH